MKSMTKVTIIYNSGKVSVHSMQDTEVMALEDAFVNAKKRSIKDISPEIFTFSSNYISKVGGKKKKYIEKTIIDLTRVDAISFNNLEE